MSSRAQTASGHTRRPIKLVRCTPQARARETPRASTAHTADSHSELTMPLAKKVVKTVWKLDRVNHCEPCPNNRGETASRRKRTTGTISSRASSTHTMVVRVRAGARTANRTLHPSPAGRWMPAGDGLVWTVMAGCAPWPSLDDVVREPRVDGVLPGAPHRGVDDLGGDAGQRGQRLEGLLPRLEGPEEGVAGRVAALHHLLAGLGEDELHELLGLGLGGGRHVGVDAEHRRQYRLRLQVGDPDVFVGKPGTGAGGALDGGQLDGAGFERLQGVGVGLVDVQAI